MRLFLIGISSAKFHQATSGAGDRISEREDAPDSVEVLADFRRGLAETGFVEGRNVAIEYRWLEGMIGFKKWSPIWFSVRSP